MVTRPSLRAGLTGIVGGSLTVALGWFLGAGSLSGVEPNNQFVSCGPAVFDRPDPLPHPLCADAYFPLPAGSVVLIAVGVVALLGSIAIVVRARSASGHVTSTDAASTPTQARADVDAAYADAYSRSPMDTPDEWGDLGTWGKSVRSR